MDSASFDNVIPEDIFKQFLESKRLVLVPIGSCQCGKSAECDRLTTEINSSKQLYIAKEKEFGLQEKTLAELLSTKNDLDEAYGKSLEKDNEVKRLKDLLLKEKNCVEEKTQEISDLKKTFENQTEILKENISKLTGFLKVLVEDVNFQTDINADLLASTELQRLLNHIKEILGKWRDARLGLQHLAKAQEAADVAIKAGPGLDSLKEHVNQNRADTSLNSMDNQSVNISENNLPIKKKEHKIDKSFKDDGYQCICKEKYKSERGILLHIRKKTEPWKYQCKFCSRKFFYKYVRNNHLKTSTKCSALQQKEDDLKKREKSKSEFQSNKIRLQRRNSSNRQPHYASAQRNSRAQEPQERIDGYQSNIRESRFQYNDHRNRRDNNFSLRDSSHRQTYSSYHHNRWSRSHNDDRQNYGTNRTTTGQQDCRRNDPVRRNHLREARTSEVASGAINNNNILPSTSSQ